MFTTLPLELFVCREVIEQYFFEDEPFHMQRHVFFTTAILCSSMISASSLLSSAPSADAPFLLSFPRAVSLVTCDLGVMLEITGGASATALAFIFPAACYLKLAAPRAPLLALAKLPALACAAFGVVVLSISLFLALGKAWTPAGAASICL